MGRGSKYNPYECPDCGYKTTRKWNLKVHIEHAHGYLPFLPEELSKKEWVWAQLHGLAKEYVKADLEGDNEKAERRWRSLISLYTYHRDLISIGVIPQIIDMHERELKPR